MRKGELENVERNRDKSLGVTVYVGQRRGNASTSDFSEAAIEQTVQAAYDIARFTAEDPVAGLPDADDIAEPTSSPTSTCSIPGTSTARRPPRLALDCEAAAFATDKRITNSEGAGVSAQQSHFFSAHTRGFRGGYASSRHSISVAPIAGKGDDMQRDAWYSSMRAADELADARGRGPLRRRARAGAPEVAQDRDHANARCCSSRRWPPACWAASCRPPAAARCTARAPSCSIRWASRCCPTHIDVLEDPHVQRGKGSAPFDEEGVRTHGAQGGRCAAGSRATS